MNIPRFFIQLSLISFLALSGKGHASITKAEYFETIKTVSTIYAPIVKEAGGKLKILTMWDSTVINASAEKDNATKEWTILTFGGLARLPKMTRDGYIIVLCHELGHHLGGYPKKRGKAEQWSSAEGQADYFANLKCARKIFAVDDNEAIVKKLNAPDFLTDSCHKSFPNEQDANICIRSSMAGKALADSMEMISAKVYNEKPSELSFEKNARTLFAKGIADDHPLSQCRLNTFFQASLCDKNVNDQLSDTSDTNGICSKKNGDTIGTRPDCWFNPN